MNNRGGAVLCPFYRRESGVSVTCEGFMPGSHTEMVFADARGCRAWQNAYCEQKYGLCPLGYLLQKKYE